MDRGSIHGLVEIFPGALGDLLLALPTLRALRDRHAGPSTLVVPEPLRRLAGLAGVAGRVASLDDAGSAWLFGGATPPTWLEGRPTVYSWLGVRDGLRERLESVAAGATLLHVERGPGAVHAAAAYARAAGLGLDRAALWRGARVAAADSRRASHLLRPMPRPVLAIHRGAGAAAKRWGGAAFAAVAAWWIASGGGVVELLGPAESDDAAADGAVVARDWPLPDVAALLAHVDAYVGNDSGVSHLAAAAGARTVAVFTATAARRWRPLGAEVRVVRSRAGAGATHPSVDRVLAALAAMGILDKHLARV